MRVKYLIEQLKEYDPDDEIIVAYWDREWFASQIEPEITDDQWLDIVGDGENVIENIEIGGYLYETARLVLDKVADDPHQH